MSFDYGCNTTLVAGFLALLGSLRVEDFDRIYMADPALATRCSADYALWHGAWLELQAALRRTGRMTAAGNAWVAVWDRLGASRITMTARNVSDALVGFDLITPEQRRILWRPFSVVAPMPGTERAA